MMFPPNAYNQGGMGFAYPGQQAPSSYYQTQYGVMPGFNPQVLQNYPQIAPPRGQSLPATGRQYQPLTGPYLPPPSLASRNQKNSQYVPPVPPKHYEQHNTHGSKSKKSHKGRSASPMGAAEQALYSDHEQQDQKQQQEKQRDQSGQQEAQIHAPPPPSRDTDQQQSQPVDDAHEDPLEGGVARSEEAQAVLEPEKPRAGSRKKKHHHRDLQENNSPQSYQTQQYSQQPNYFGELRTELPPQLKVHRQPLYAGYNQAYEESIRRGDITRKHAKRLARLPPEFKQKLFPHEDDQKPQLPTTQQQPFQFGTNVGYNQQPYGGIRSTFNPYQPYGPPATQQNYYSTNPVSGPYNALQPWTNQGVLVSSNEQEVQHLMNRIRTLEDEVQKLQRKLQKAKLRRREGSAEKTEDNHSHQRSNRNTTGTPQQTPVVVELNSIAGETIRDQALKKNPNQTTNDNILQNEQQRVQQVAPSVHQLENNTAVQHSTNLTSTQNQRTINTTEISQPPMKRVVEVESKPAQSKPTREEIIAQIVNQTVVHPNNRQGLVGVSKQQQQQQQLPGPAPPPVISQLGRPQLPNQQKQFLYQPGVLPPQGQHVITQGPRLPPVMNNVVYQGDPYRQQYANIHQRPTVNQNYNQSNNNELYDNDDDDDDDDEDDDDNDDDNNDDEASDDINEGEHDEQLEPSHSAEKILDAFERFYVNHGKSTSVPIKVKYIPEESNSNYARSNCQQLNTNNNNNNYRFHVRSRRSHSNNSLTSPSIDSDSQSISNRSNYDNTHKKSVCNCFCFRRPTRSYDDYEQYSSSN